MSTELVLKKHVAAIHISNNISLLQRKLSNVLLLNAFAELKDKDIPVHAIQLPVLCEMVGFDSHNYDYLREALDGMVTTSIRWNLSDDDGVVSLGTAAILSQAEILPRTGILEYAYPPRLREMMSEPGIYALIDVRVQQRFQSGYALALFENCLRYVSVGVTREWSLDLFKMLMGTPQDGSYDDFKLLNFHVIKKAAKEVNAVSPIEVEPIFHKEGRRVVKVQFKVSEKSQGALQLEAPPFNEALLRRLIDEFELSEPQAKAILAVHPEDYITGNLAIVAERFQKGDVKKLGPYVLKAFREDFRVKPSKLKAVRKAEITANQMQAAKSPVDTSAVREWLDQMNADEQAALEDQYRAAKHPQLIRKRLEEKGMGHPMVQADFLNFVARSMPAGK